MHNYTPHMSDMPLYEACNLCTDSLGNTLLCMYICACTFVMYLLHIYCIFSI